MKIRTAIAGLGRMGCIHAENLRFRTRKADLVAACDPDPERREKGKSELGIRNIFTEFNDMIHRSDLDAVIIVTPSVFHCRQIRDAIHAGLHVFCEKPLGTDLDECQETARVIENNPEQVFMLGFMRRYDTSYRYAKQKVEERYLGKPILFRGYSVDPESAIGGILSFLPKSGGQFNDMAVHDFDLARWFLKSEPRSVYAIGGCFAHPEFADYDDGDNVAALMQFENDSMAFFLAGRTAPHGYNIETEIIGTQATLRIGAVPQMNLVELMDETGIRKECSRSFPTRFGPAFLAEIQEFIDCIHEKRKPEITVYDGLMASKMAVLATESFRNNKPIVIK
jgi:myo-inositol 2-dehydrogenase/D-chiro-inositol 1-dehydrogenase